jgi:hypothetical protein
VAAARSGPRPPASGTAPRRLTAGSEAVVPRKNRTSNAARALTTPDSVGPVPPQTRASATRQAQQDFTIGNSPEAKKAKQQSNTPAADPEVSRAQK